MDFEDELRKLNWSLPQTTLRVRVLRDAHAARRSSRIIPPWFAAFERHWLYPGRIPTGTLVAAWLLILLLRVSTPASLLPHGGPIRPLSREDFARLRLERAQLFVELRRETDDLDAAPSSGVLPPRS
jgi:hypothetical protein